MALEGRHQDLLKTFVELTSSKQDHTWREVDALQEKLQAQESNLNSKVSQVGQINTTLEQLKEWMTSVISKYNTYLVKLLFFQTNVPKKVVKSRAVVTSQGDSFFYKQFHPFLPQGVILKIMKDNRKTYP